jgi:hypothetical protein
MPTSLTATTNPQPYGFAFARLKLGYLLGGLRP